MAKSGKPVEMSSLEAILLSLDKRMKSIENLEARIAGLEVIGSVVEAQAEANGKNATVDASVVKNIWSESEKTPPVVKPADRPIPAIARVVKSNTSEALIGNADGKSQERMIYTAAGYGFAVEPTTTIAEYRKACEAAKASGRKWRMAYALSAWKAANPGKLAYGVLFTPEQNKAAIDAWKASKRTSSAPSVAPSVDLTAKAKAMRDAGFSAQEVYAALNA